MDMWWALTLGLAMIEPQEDIWGVGEGDQGYVYL